MVVDIPLHLMEHKVVWGAEVLWEALKVEAKEEVGKSVFQDNCI